MEGFLIFILFIVMIAAGIYLDKVIAVKTNRSFRLFAYLLPLLLFIGSKYDDLFKPPADTGPKQPMVSEIVEPGAIMVDAFTLWQSYQENEVRADENWKGKLIRITGNVDEIGKDMFGKPYIKFITGNYGMSCDQCLFENTEGLSRLNKGNQVTIEGRVVGMVVTDVVISGCKLK